MIKIVGFKDFAATGPLTISTTYSCLEYFACKVVSFVECFLIETQNIVLAVQCKFVNIPHYITISPSPVTACK